MIIISSYNEIDVTDRVYGKMEHDQMKFYLDQHEIGYLANGTEVILQNGFEYKADRFYQLFEKEAARVEQYVNNCDQGWC